MDSVYLTHLKQILDRLMVLAKSNKTGQMVDVTMELFIKSIHSCFLIR